MKNTARENKLIKVFIYMTMLLSALITLLFIPARPLYAISAEWNGTAAGGFAGGSGSQSDPYLISTAEQLAYFSNRVNAGIDYQAQYLKLTQDILLNAMTDNYTFDPADQNKREFTAIGSTSGSKAFKGVFDGNGMKIIGLYINQPTKDYQGLFGITDKHNGIGDINNVSVYGAVTGKDYVGGIAGYTTGSVFRCINYCTVNGVNQVGGIVGLAYNNSSIRNCLNLGVVNGTNNVGGVAGSVDKSNLEMGNNLNIGEVTGTTNVGGVAGVYNSGSDSWNNYTTVEPAIGSIGGNDDIEDGGVFIGTNPTGEEWEEIIDNLNGLEEARNEDGHDIWTDIIGGVPTIGIFLPSAKVAGGKYYTYAVVPETSTLAVTADSAFSVAYRVSYSAAAGTELSTQTIGFKQGSTAVTLPANTTVIMLADGVYYYKNLTEDLAGSITLNQFIKMGTTATTYPSQTAAANATKLYDFIFDFSHTAGIAAGTSNIEFLIAGGTTTGTVPTVTVAGKNSYALTTTGGINSSSVTFANTGVTGYDYKTDGKSYFYEIYLEQSGATLKLPIGTIVNGTLVSGYYPYTFLSANVDSATAVSIDMSGCDNPLTAGEYTMQVKVYASSYAATPRNGSLLAAGSVPITLSACEKYGIRAVAGTQFFDASAAAVSVPFTIQTLGTGNVQVTLQRKYGSSSYANVPGQVNQPVNIVGEAASLTIPAGSPKGTYRFVLTIYNSLTPRAKSIQNIIIK